VRRRVFTPADVAGAWLVVAAAPAEVNRAVAAAARRRPVFVVAVDDVASASAYGAATLCRGGVTVAVSTGGEAPALAGLLREALEELLPEELEEWSALARRTRREWRERRVPISERRPLLLQALDALYARRAAALPAGVR
jgi:siroheme synthase-like protein